jgi:hypothetical protein
MDEESTARPVAEAPRRDDVGVERVQRSCGHPPSIWIVLVTLGATVARDG